MLDVRQIDALQSEWQLPFEWVDTTPHLDEPTWAVVMDDGNVLHASGPYQPAILLRIDGELRLWAMSETAQQACLEFAESLPHAQHAAEGWLLRFCAQGPQRRSELLCLRGPEQLETRQAQPDSVALLLDFGRVLCHFDYRWFVWGHHAVFGHEPAPHALAEIENLRPHFEAGDMSEDDFFATACRHLELLPADRQLFCAAWANILRMNHDMEALARHAARQENWQIIIVSNIDPILVRETVQRFGLADLFDNGVYSYAESVRPKHEDASMWRLAHQRASQQLGGAPTLCVATDDTPANLVTAAGEACVDGVIQFRQPWQWQFELGKLGAYLPRTRGSLVHNEN